jgi:carbonic anhydrase
MRRGRPTVTADDWALSSTLGSSSTLETTLGTWALSSTLGPAPDATPGTTAAAKNTDAPTATATLLRNAARFAARHTGRALPAQPATGVAVVACMDARLDVFALFGLAEGDAHILRNAGGVVTDDVHRSLAVSQHELGTTEIMLVHHTDCGMQRITDDGFARKLEGRTGVRPGFGVHAFTDPADDVRASLAVLRSSPFLRASTSIRGFVYDVLSRRLDEVSGTSQYSHSSHGLNADADADADGDGDGVTNVGCGRT